MEGNKIIIGALIILLIVAVSFNLGITGEITTSSWISPTQTVQTIQPTTSVKYASSGFPAIWVNYLVKNGYLLTDTQCKQLCYKTSTITPIFTIPTAPIIGQEAGKETMLSGTCSDSDGGYNLFKAGTCRDKNRYGIYAEHKDRCIDSTTLEEWYCVDYLDPDWGPNTLPYKKCVSKIKSCAGASRVWGSQGSCISSIEEKAGMCHGPKDPPEANEPIPLTPPK